jgi:polar amino acid transport system permease protein
VNYVFDFSSVLRENDSIVSGLLLTIRISLLSIVLGLCVGIVCAAIQADERRSRPVTQIAIDTYVETIRNTPFLAQVFVIFFALPGLGLRLSASSSALIAMTINLGAYSTEIVRAGIESVHRSQREAGAALGLTPFKTLVYVVLPPALEKVYPALVSQFTLMMLATSLVSQISVQELTYVGQMIESRSFRSLRYIASSHSYTLVWPFCSEEVFGCWALLSLQGVVVMLSVARYPRVWLSDFSFLLQATQWTLVLSAITFYGGGILGFAVPCFERPAHTVCASHGA